MAKKMMYGVGGVAKAIPKAYWGVDGVARKIKKAYYGVDGVAKLVFESAAPSFIPTVTFSANGGTGSMTSITGSSVTIPSSGFTRSGYRFDRWNTKADGSGTSYTAGQTTTLTGDVTLYAIWVQQVTVTYYKIYAAGNTSSYPPASNSGPISGYLDLKVGNVTVPYLDDKFTASGNLSPTRTLTVDKGTSLYVMAKNYLGSNRCNIYVNGSQVAANTSSASYSLPNGIQSNVEVQMMWTMEFLLGTVPTSSAWTIGISGGT